METKENIENNTTNYDPTVGWLELLNILHDATPIIAKKLIPGKLLGLANNISYDDVSYSKKLYEHLKKQKHSLYKVNQTFIDSKTPNNILKEMDLINLEEILQKLFKKKSERKKLQKSFKSLIDVRNAILNGGKSAVEERRQFKEYNNKIKDALANLGIPLLEEININVKVCGELVKDVIECKKEYDEKFERLFKKLQEQRNISKLKNSNIKKVKDDSPHTEKSQKLTEVFKKGNDDPEYGGQLKCIDDSIYYVDHDDFLICSETENGCVYLGYHYHHHHPWIALKIISTTGGEVPKELKIMEMLYPNNRKGISPLIKGFSEDNLCYLAMELYDYTLNEYINKSPSADERCKIAKKLLEAITFLHCKYEGKPSIVHHNLSPSNVLIKVVGDLNAESSEKLELKIVGYGKSVKHSYEDSSSIKSEDSIIWHENDVFSTNLLLTFILSSEVMFEEDKNSERVSTEDLQSIQKRILELDIHEDIRKFLSTNVENYSEFKKIIQPDKMLMEEYENIQLEKESKTKKRVSKREKELKEKLFTNYSKETLKKTLKISNVKDQFKELYYVKHPKSTKGRRYSALVICNKEKLRDDMNKKLATTPMKGEENQEKIEIVQEEAIELQNSSFGGMEDTALIRDNLEKCKFSELTETADPDKKEFLDMNKDVLIELFKKKKEELEREDYSGDVYLFLWILAHGYFDKDKNDTYFSMGEGEAENLETKVSVKELLSEIQQEINGRDDESCLKLKTIAVIDCCREEKEGTKKRNTANNREVNPTNAIVLYSVPAGKQSKGNLTGTSYAWDFAKTVAQHIEPGENIQKMFKKIIEQITEKEDTPEMCLYEPCDVKHFNF